MISRSADFESAASTDFAIQAVICGAQCETWTHKSFDSSFWDYSVYRFRQSRWCPFTESNYELIITSDLLCHLTKRALAGVAGIGPAHVRVKVWCLTSWLHPKIFIALWYLWRRDRDSNPGGAYTPNGFQDRRFRPLSHLSKKSIVLRRTFEIMCSLIDFAGRIWPQRLLLAS